MAAIYEVMNNTSEIDQWLTQEKIQGFKPMSELFGVRWVEDPPDEGECTNIFINKFLKKLAKMNNFLIFSKKLRKHALIKCLDGNPILL